MDGKEVAKNSMDHTTPVTLLEDETFDIGEGTRTPLVTASQHEWLDSPENGFNLPMG
jgi:hypothetical protein